MATDYPSPRSDLANLRKDNQRPRRSDPRPSKSVPPAPHSKPNRRENNSHTNAAKPFHRLIDAKGWVLGASHRSNHWALDSNPDPAIRPGRLLRQLEQALLPIPTRKRACRSPAGLPYEHNGPGVISRPARRHDLAALRKSYAARRPTVPPVRPLALGRRRVSSRP